MMIQFRNLLEHLYPLPSDFVVISLNIQILTHALSFLIFKISPIETETNIQIFPQFWKRLIISN